MTGPKYIGKYILYSFMIDKCTLDFLSASTLQQTKCLFEWIHTESQIQAMKNPNGYELLPTYKNTMFISIYSVSPRTHL